MRIVHRAGSAGVAAARKTEIFAHRLAGDRAASVENARDDGRVDIRHIAFHRRGAVHHRHPGDADIVLDGKSLARADEGRHHREVAVSPGHVASDIGEPEDAGTHRQNRQRTAGRRASRS